MKYWVDIVTSETVIKQTQVLVEADNEDEARELAWNFAEHIDKGLDDEVDWMNHEVIEVNDVTPTEEE
jgi:hypothetical protein